MFAGFNVCNACKCELHLETDRITAEQSKFISIIERTASFDHLMHDAEPSLTQRNTNS